MTRRATFPLRPGTCTDNGQSGEARRYSKLNDHVVDALRVAELRKLTADWADFTPPLVYATPTASPIDSLEILRRM